MDWAARKPMTLLGVAYRPRSVVPLDGMRISPALRRRLIEQRRVVPHVVESAADVHIGKIDDVEVEIAVQDIRCEANTGAGNRCKRDATGNGLCKIHRNALARRASNESTEG